jgi:hypothetical protein
MFWDVTPCGLADKYQRHLLPWWRHQVSSKCWYPTIKNTASHKTVTLTTSVPFRLYKQATDSWPTACSNTSLWIIQRRHKENSGKLRTNFLKVIFLLCIDDWLLRGFKQMQLCCFKINHSEQSNVPLSCISLHIRVIYIVSNKISML